MIRHFEFGGILGSGAVVMLLAQPVLAQPTQVTTVQVNPADGGIELVLQTRRGDRPQIFTVSRGNTLIADIINTQLDLPEGNGFIQNNPAPGIGAVMVSQLDNNSVRVTVTGDAAAPIGQVSQSGQTIVLNFSPADGTTAQAPASAQGSQTAPAPAAQPAPAPSQTAQATPQPSPQSDDVLVPNPDVSIDNVPLPGTAPTQPLAPPVSSRAIAPPVGDIAVSTVDSAASSIDLGTAERVPRLVLRDAPVRDVLSLLARAAGLNVAYVGGEAAAPAAGAAQPPGAEAQGQQDVRISLDIENEPVQDVFNYVLRISGLEANRNGRTIFVGPRLPDEARNVITRTLRLNQVTAAQAATFLATQGAESRQFFQVRRIETIGEGAAARTVDVTEPPQIVTVQVQRGVSPLLLAGLSVTVDQRLNAITLVGEPRKIQIASELLAQLDLRQRQVAINVKIVDVNLVNSRNFNTSFSFGIGDSFFVSDGGAATFNFGGTRPPTTDITRGSVTSPPITTAPFPGGAEVSPFLDAQPDAPFGSDENTGNPAPFFPSDPRFPFGRLPRAPFGTNDNPFQPGITNIDEDGIEFGLPTLFQYPTRFLAALQAQVQSGNAKILTDPTLVVQEGQEARVALTQQVPTNIVTTFDDETGRATTSLQLDEAGVTLGVRIDRIDDNGFVTMGVAPRVAAPAENREFQDTQLTLLAVRQLQSGLLRVRDGQTLILSGIIQESDRTTVSKVPILGDIPILGALFRSTNRQNQRNEVIILLTPNILDDSEGSNFGYRYTPGQETQQFLQERGVTTP